MNPERTKRAGMQRSAEILIAFLVSALSIAFAINLIRNYTTTTSGNWGYMIMPGPLVLVSFYVGIIFGIGIAGWLLLSLLLSLLAQPSPYCSGTSRNRNIPFLTDGLFIFVLPSTAFFFFLWKMKTEYYSS